tara:strand:- start:807 stop:1028 length:222 start_codon:yes stop_codon:yes gene_type:complete
MIDATVALGRRLTRLGVDSDVDSDVAVHLQRPPPSPPTPPLTPTDNADPLDPAAALRARLVQQGVLVEHSITP